MFFRGFEIKGVFTGFPANKLDIVENGGSKHDALKFSETTGIRYRYKTEFNKFEQVQEWTALSENALKRLHWSPEDIDVCVVVTQTHLNSIPGVAYRLNHKLGLKPECLCYDINAGCSGYVQGLHLAMGLMCSLGLRNVKALLCVGDFSSQIVNERDSATNSLFSDALSVTGLVLGENLTNVAEFNFHSRGDAWEAIKSEIEPNLKRELLFLDGIDVYQNAVDLVPKSINELRLGTEELPYLVLHQANKLINSKIEKKLNWEDSRVLRSLHEYGNSGSASIPVTLALNKVRDEEFVLSGFGVGFSVATVKIRLPKDVVYSEMFFK